MHLLIAKNTYPKCNYTWANRYPTHPKKASNSPTPTVAYYPPPHKGGLQPPSLKRGLTAPIPEKGANKPPRLEFCEKIVLAKLAALIFQQGSLLCLSVLNYHLDPLQGILWLFPRAPYTTWENGIRIIDWWKHFCKGHFYTQGCVNVI